jgi:hypothetical protein
VSLSNAPIYAKAYHFHLEIFDVTKNFAKCYRPSLGQKLESTALELTIGIRSALFAKGNHGFKRLLPLVDRLKVLIQTSFDLKLIGIGRYGKICEQIHEIARILNALQRSSLDANHSPNRTNSLTSKPY